MYKKILVALENSKADGTILPHVAELAGRFQSQLLLLHVADGWVARNFNRLKLAESDEMKADRAYLESVASHLRAQGRDASAQLALGDPPGEIVRVAESEQCDLIAMASHGHRFLADFFLGSTINQVRHITRIPILLVRAGTKTD
jgi:nucleotide-binding universal stress UspA family protein